ncbi:MULTISPECIES: nucleoside triphosphate pyrophosphohydrolase [unclassified Candidatus Frackibacter]|uniref:nucleoside triphosphate pyrophosphohydrolase n=1 Tax=unclassified Candidatus Frackibacter TaxID=2648818 RepID=UPI0007965A0F|nr:MULTISPECIES: nucleoside triphosphate pyrophosphohydrolase [unclassified Candidatus Frackibacter]KXS45673.1 MAG: MazG family protein [Candidatus Frackibacter sp. T328-2]SEM79719.1 tetrapyrrole methylase family protein / MazG family protein [Candidatus Frackibacter sp. WG12]SFL90414.1 tetrapyrrole methylase family protein / MazG family protein [Candidatus Frackibacter sp. WG13]
MLDKELGNLKVIGLGPGKIDHLTLGAYEALQRVDKLFLRTREHPIVEQLSTRDIEFKTFDSIYNDEENFNDVYEKIKEVLITQLKEGLDVGYAVPGNPLVAEESVRKLLAEVDPGKIGIISGESFLDVIFTSLNIDPIEGLQVLDSLSFTKGDLSTNQHLMLTQFYNQLVASNVKLTLLEVYPEDHSVVIIKAAGISELEKRVEVPLYELDRVKWIDHLTSVYIPPLKGKVEGNLNQMEEFNTLVKIMEKLRADDGCPWDLKQDHNTLRPYLIEETYEVLERIENEDILGLCEEIGDLLLQVVFHAQIAKENDEFDIEDVIYSISDKMIRRHPHVFGTEKLKTADAVLDRWEDIKAVEKNDTTDDTETILAVTEGLPALMEAQKIQKKAAEVGFDWPSIKGTLNKLEEELIEFKAALKSEDKDKIRDELGDLLFAIVNVGRFLDFHLELVLKDATNKFKRRFSYIESALKKEEAKFKDKSLEELEELWREAKKEE